MTKFNYRIYQLPISNNNIFRGYRDSVDMNDYCCTYTGVMNTTTDNELEVCEDLFHTFNCNHPANFGGHSMSVSDVVAISREDSEQVNFYYCDSFGFKKFITK